MLNLSVKKKTKKKSRYLGGNKHFEIGAREDQIKGVKDAKAKRRNAGDTSKRPVILALETLEEGIDCCRLNINETGQQH